MNLAINLDDNTPIKAHKIQNNLAQRMLATEFMTTRSFAQFAPNQDFGEVA
jgi:hypothetical protein